MNVLEKMITAISPERGAKRAEARARIAALEQATELSARYDAARSSRLTKGWGSITPSPKINAQQLGYDSNRMRSRARDLYQNNLLAKAIIDRIVNESIGQGFNFRSLSSDTAFKAEVETYFYDWARRANVNGDGWRTTLRTILRYLLIDGDVGIVLRNGGIQIVDAARIGGTLAITENNGNQVIEGVELNANGKPVAFHIDNGVDATPRSARIAAKDFIFLSIRKLPNQVRGETLFAQSFDLFDWLIEYTEASVVAAKMAACFSVAITTPNPTNFLSNTVQSDTGTANGSSTRLVDLDAGGMTILPPGADVRTITATQPTTTYEQFITSLLRQITASCGITIEALGNIGQTSFSASRMSVEVARDSYRNYQYELIEGVLERLYVWAVSKAAKDGELSAMPQDGTSHEWQPPAFRYYDPQTDIAADAMGIETGIFTMTEVQAKRGKWLDEHLAEQAAEQKLMKEYDIKNANSQMTQGVSEDEPQTNESQ